MYWLKGPSREQANNLHVNADLCRLQVAHAPRTTRQQTIESLGFTTSVYDVTHYGDVRTTALKNGIQSASLRSGRRKFQENMKASQRKWPRDYSWMIWCNLDGCNYWASHESGTADSTKPPFPQDSLTASRHKWVKLQESDLRHRPNISVTKEKRKNLKFGNGPVKARA